MVLKREIFKPSTYRVFHGASFFSDVIVSESNPSNASFTQIPRKYVPPIGLQSGSRSDLSIWVSEIAKGKMRKNGGPVLLPRDSRRHMGKRVGNKKIGYGFHSGRRRWLPLLPVLSRKSCLPYEQAATTGTHCGLLMSREWMHLKCSDRVRRSRCISQSYVKVTRTPTI